MKNNNNNNLAPPTFSIPQIRFDNSKNILSIAIAILLTIFEGVIFYLYFISVLALPLLILLHCAILALLGYFLFSCARKKYDLRFPLLLFLSAYSAGPFGTFGFVILSILFPLFSKHSTPLRQWFEELFPEGGYIYDNAFERIKAGWDDYLHQMGMDITPFLDVFTYGSLSQKQSILDSIVKDFNPAFIPILKRALVDSNNTIRIQAAAIVSKIDINQEKHLKELLKEQSMDPENDEILLKIAEHFDYLAFTGLLDPLREKESRKASIYYYKKYLKTHPDHLASWIAVGRLQLRRRNFKEVVSWFDEFQKRFKEIPGNALLWYLEALFKLGDYEALSNAAKLKVTNLDEETLSKEALETLRTWAK